MTTKKCGILGVFKGFGYFQRFWVFYKGFGWVFKVVDPPLPKKS